MAGGSGGMRCCSRASDQEPEGRARHPSFTGGGHEVLTFFHNQAEDRVENDIKEKEKECKDERVNVPRLWL